MAKSNIKTHKKQKAPKKSIKGVVLKLDNIFSKYIRLSNANSSGAVKCFTCNEIWFWTDVDCGHYITRDNRNTRWDEQNCKPQCKKCNRFKDGMKDVFALNLQKEYGDDILQILNEKKNQIKKYTWEDLNNLYQHYKSIVIGLGG